MLRRCFALTFALKLARSCRGAVFALRRVVTFATYSNPNGYDELLTADGQPRSAVRHVAELLERLGIDELRARQGAAEAAIRALGITFTVYSQGSNRDREWPFDIIPRAIPRSEWDKIAIGCRHFA